MRRRLGIVVVVAALVMPVALPAAQDQDASLPKAHVSAVTAALQAVRAGKWTLARRIANRSGDERIRDLVLLLRLTRSPRQPKFDELSGFMDRRPDWPKQSLLQSRAEAALAHGIPREAVRAWFRDHPPTTANGRILHVQARLAEGRTAEAITALRRLWVDGDFTAADEKRFYAKHRKSLTRDDHVARLDRLLWEGRISPARRMLWRIKGDERLLGEARLLLRVRAGNVDTAIAKVPARLRDHPGLIYERLRWRRRMGRTESALELLEPPPADLVRPDIWWRDKAILVRKLLREGHVSRSYALARDHGLREGADFAEAEWLAGWIALRFLKDYQAALKHFTALHARVTYPISLARAAYWSGRAAEALGKKPMARHWYAKAVAFPTTYYGQLAQSRSGPGPAATLPEPALIDPKTGQRFANHDLTYVVRLVAAADNEDIAQDFALALNGVEESPAWRRLAGRLARQIGRPHLAIRLAKRSARDGHVDVEASHPLLAPPRVYKRSEEPEVDPPLVLSVIRQESEFKQQAISGSGARGLMQLMPSTARAVARQLKLRYSKHRLTSDPIYNMRLGQAYLAGLLRQFGGSYVLALAAYNAGPARARRWSRDLGDPRDGEVDVIDWIEAIPFAESRNYVQRVMESVQVYRSRLNRTEIAESLESDLQR